MPIPTLRRPRFLAASASLVISPAIAAVATGQYALTPSPVLNTTTMTADPRLSGFVTARETVRDDSAAFSLARARMGAQALVAPFTAVRLQADIVSPAVTDGYIQLSFPDTTGRAARLLRPALIVGQFKTPFSLEYLTSFSTLLTVNRSLIVDRHAARRDMGAVAYVRLSRYGTIAGALVNGEGANQPANADGEQMALGRLTLVPLPQVAIAAKLMNEGGDHRWGYDARLIVNDELIVEGEAVKRTAPVGADHVDAGGGYALIAYRPVRWAQPVVKWERFRELVVTPTTSTERAATFMTYGVNLLGPRDRLRLQLNWIAKTGDRITGDDEMVVQLHAIF